MIVHHVRMNLKRFQAMVNAAATIKMRRISYDTSFRKWDHSAFLSYQSRQCPTPAATAAPTRLTSAYGYILLPSSWLMLT